MRKTFMVKMVLVALLMTLSRFGVATAAPEATQANMASMTASELEKAGDEARMQKNYPDAIRFLRAALNKDKKNSTLYNKVGLAEMNNNNLRAARLDFEKAARYDSKSANAVNNIGAVDFVYKNYRSATKYFRKAVALEETRATFHVNLGAAWFGQSKVDRAVAEYTRALELDPEVLKRDSRAGVVAQIPSPEERARYSYMLAKIYARRGDVDNCIECLKKAKEGGYRNLAGVYKEEDFSRMWQDSRLHDVVPPPAAK